MLTSRVLRRAFSAQVQVPKVSLTQLYINGQFQDSLSGKTITKVDARTEQPIADFQCAGVEDIDAAVQAARAAFDDGPWTRMSGTDRGVILHKLAQLMFDNAEELAALETLDNGKPIFWSTNADIPLSASHFRYYAGWADKINGVIAPCTTWFGTPMQHLLLKEPVGVVGQIIPWNFPLLMAAWKMAPALAAGCTIVLKPSEKTPMTALVLARLAAEAGVPEGVINIVPGDGAAGEALARHPGTDKIGFTGSVATAMKIKSVMGLKPFTAELGGKSPVLVFDDADVDFAVNLTHFALFFNHGQCCAAGSRALVHESIYDQFLEKLVASVSARTVGDPFTNVDQGPLVDELQFNRVLGFINNAKNAGINCATGGERHGSEGFYVQPTIFTDVPADAELNRLEVFGPVLGVNKFSTEEEAIAIANDTTYGLAAGIISNNADRINRVSRRIRAGTIWVNTHNVYDNSAPFGGYKESGVGREKGMEALDNFLQTKTVTTPLVGNTGWYR